ncbi:hypothetical protein PIB30_038920 [Stylosanthes scabra]|uniref:Uncharacterized protein n=1 Tax=Stylosanthes scabra TaxID=79078 RepID=A0ABU6RET3_9FABA|nr:hypothetical protein [Stylosanthes scabra]
MELFSRRLSGGGATTSTGVIQLRRPSSETGITTVHYNYDPLRRRRSITLRSPMRLVVAAASEVRSTRGSGAFERSEELAGREKAAGPCSYAVEEDAAVAAAAAGASRQGTAVEVAVAVAATVVTGVGNRVLYKLALVPLKQYPFFLAQLATFGYVIVYFSIMYIRQHAGIVTEEMLSMPKAPYVLIGILEALAAATGMAAAAILSGASIPILSQSFLVWQILLSILFLGRRYKPSQILGCFLVTIGVIITVASGSSAGNSLKEGGVFWSLLMIVSFFLQAADTVLKEIIFLDANRKLKCGSVDLFVVNSYGSAFQCRHYLYSFSSPSFQNYGAYPSVNYQPTLKMVQPAS